jgi:hypothetical protein
LAKERTTIKRQKKIKYLVIIISIIHRPLGRDGRPVDPHAKLASATVGAAGPQVCRPQVRRSAGKGVASASGHV